MTTEELIKRAKNGAWPHELTERMTRPQLQLACTELLQRIVKDEIELDQLIEQVDRNNRELDKLTP